MLPSTDAILVLVACASPAEGEAIATALLERRLVACATIGGAVRSRYWWEGKIEAAEETPLLLKTLREHFPALETEIRRLHSYQVPEILAVSITAGSAPYLAWLAEAAGNQRRTI